MKDGIVSEVVLWMGKVKYRYGWLESGHRDLARQSSLFAMTFKPMHLYCLSNHL